MTDLKRRANCKNSSDYNLTKSSLLFLVLNHGHFLRQETLSLFSAVRTYRGQTKIQRRWTTRDPQLLILKGNKDSELLLPRSWLLRREKGCREALWSPLFLRSLNLLLYLLLNLLRRSYSGCSKTAISFYGWIFNQILVLFKYSSKLGFVEHLKFCMRLLIQMSHPFSNAMLTTPCSDQLDVFW